MKKYFILLFVFGLILDVLVVGKVLAQTGPSCVINTVTFDETQSAEDFPPVLNVKIIGDTQPSGFSISLLDEMSNPIPPVEGLEASFGPSEGSFSIDVTAPENYSIDYPICESNEIHNADIITYTVVSTYEEPALDTTAPVITLLGDTTVHLTVGDTYTDAGATANDDVDGIITDDIEVINPVDTATAGTYTVTYNVSDAAGNSATEMTRTVIVSDATIDSPEEVQSTRNSSGGGRRHVLSNTSAAPAVLGAYTNADRQAKIAELQALLNQIIQMFEELKQAGLIS